MDRRDNYEDSCTLDNYVYFINKKDQEQDVQPAEIQKVQYFNKKIRKNSTQLSIFSWLVKDKKHQTSLLISLDKQLILKIYSYLRLSQIVKVSQVSSYMYSCCKSLWLDRSFFQQFQTQKFTSQELNKVMQKSKLDHIRQLKQIYMGKNIRKNRQKIKLKITDGNHLNGAMLEIFNISPKIRHGVVFIMDSHLENIIKSSYKGLKCLELNRCAYIKNITNVSKCLQLQRLTISFNQYLTTQTLAPIIKRCLKLQVLQISDCKNMDQNIFSLLKNVTQLRSLTLKHFKQSFGKIHYLSQCQHLQNLNIDDSLINDEQFMNGLRQLKNVKYLSIQGCVLLKQLSIDFLIQYVQKDTCKIVSIQQNRVNNFTQQKIQQLKQKLYRKSLGNVFHL